MADDVEKLDKDDAINAMETLSAKLDVATQELEECRKKNTLIEQLYTKVGGTSTVCRAYLEYIKI